MDNNHEQERCIMESDLTKRIKVLTHRYKPHIPSQMRTIRWADEVWTPSGIVDSIRFEDYYSSDRYLCALLHQDQVSDSALRLAEKSGYSRGVCFRDGLPRMGDKKCAGCVYRSHTYTVGMMVTCYEVKISLSDFHSPNGHNFHGNENFYCVPKALATSVAQEAPSHVGVLAYYETENQFGLRMFKPAVWQEVSDAIKVQLLYNAMKKWCDGAVFLPHEP